MTLPMYFDRGSVDNVCREMLRPSKVLAEPGLLLSVVVVPLVELVRPVAVAVAVTLLAVLVV